MSPPSTRKASMLSGIVSVWKERSYVPISTLRKSIEFLKTENYLYESYLQKMDPSSLINWQCSADTLNYYEKMSSRSKKSIISSASSVRLSTCKFASKMSIQYKIELVEKEISLMNEDHKVIMTQYTNKRTLFVTKLEELHLNMDQCETFIENFKNCINENKSKAGRLPGEKIIKHISKNIKDIDKQILKLRLERYNLFTKLRIISSLLTKKKEIRHFVKGATDFECLSLINANLRKKLLDKKLTIKKIRMSTAQAKVNLSVRKQFLDFQCKKFLQLKKEVKNRQLKDETLQNTSKNIVHELKLMKYKVTSITSLWNKWSTPSVQSYVNAKKELSDLKIQIKFWKRKQRCQQVQIKILKNKLENRRNRCGSINTETPLFSIAEVEKNE